MWRVWWWGRACSTIAAASVLILAACGSGGADDAVESVGVSSVDVAGGRLNALPSGPLFMRINHFTQAAAAQIGSKKHQPGFVYQIAGSQMMIIGADSATVSAGEGYFVPGIEHTHTNSGSTSNDWLFVALWPTDIRTQPNVSTAQVVFESEDIAPSTLQAGAYAETLQVVTIQPGGHTNVRKRSGLQVLFVLDGSLRARTDNATTVLGSNSGTYLAPNSRYQEIAADQKPVKLLDFIVTPVGQPFEQVAPAF